MNVLILVGVFGVGFYLGLMVMGVLSVVKVSSLWGRVRELENFIINKLEKSEEEIDE